MRTVSESCAEASAAAGTPIARRQLLNGAAATCLGLLGTTARIRGSETEAGRVMTVLGPIAPAALGSALCHEHVLVDFAGADRIRPGAYDLDEAYRVVLPHLQRVRKLGCRGIVECTPAYLGRMPRLLGRLARATGLHIVTNTGYYGAGNDKFVPSRALGETVDGIAARWVEEWRAGIDGTGIRPGFIKTGVDAGPLSAIDGKLVRAAARTHLRTGLTIASHTGDTRAALDQMAVLSDESVAPDAFIWVHAQNDWDAAPRLEAARKGAWIEIDNVGPEALADCVRRASELRAAGVLNRLLVSHDAGWYRPGEPRGGRDRFRPFETVYTAFVPALRSAGWTTADLRQLLIGNPAEAFTVRVRPAGGRR